METGCGETRLECQRLALRYRANSGNGISIIGTSTGNIIGTDNDSTNDTAERNLISGNWQAGVRIEADANTVAGNYIGTDVTGTLDRGNSGDGIFANSAANLTISDNVISGNAGQWYRFQQCHKLNHRR